MTFRVCFSFRWLATVGFRRYARLLRLSTARLCLLTATRYCLTALRLFVVWRVVVVVVVVRIVSCEETCIDITNKAKIANVSIFRFMMLLDLMFNTARRSALAPVSTVFPRARAIRNLNYTKAVKLTRAVMARAEVRSDRSGLATFLISSRDPDATAKRSSGRRIRRRRCRSSSRN